MKLNDEVIALLKEAKIDKSDGLLYLLGVYYGLDVQRTCTEATIKAVNVTKIVELDFTNKVVKWNMPLFETQQTEWDWVKNEFNVLWDRNKDRKASNPDCVKRMQEFFKKYPLYRKDDVMRATKAYHASQKDAGYLKNSAAFIFDGAGAMKKSILLGWCEKGNTNVNSQLKGIIAK